MRSLRAIIVDDEPIARDRLRRLLEAEAGVEVVGDCANARELLCRLLHDQVDVIFLDITMPEMDGFEAIARLPKPKPEIVFVTAHADFAVRAFGVEAVDYLLKPTSAARLSATLSRLRKAIRRRGERGSPRVALPVSGRIQLVSTAEIDFVEAEENYITVHANGQCYSVRRPLTWIQEILSSCDFIRVHKSYIVRATAVVAITPIRSGRFSLLLDSGATIPTGRLYQEIVRKTFRLLQVGR